MHVLDRGQRREEVVALEYEADALAAEIGKAFGREADGLVAGEVELAAGRGQDAAENRKQRCLAAARRAHQQRELAGAKIHADALQDVKVAGARLDGLGDVARLHDRLARGGVGGAVIVRSPLVCKLAIR